MVVQTGGGDEERNRSPNDVENLLLLQSIRSDTFEPPSIFVELSPPGSSPYGVICNSVPKSGTYLLVEMTNAAGLWTDACHHGYRSPYQSTLVAETAGG
jgi:hypothetical protein